MEQIIKILPRTAWQNIVIKENDEPLIEVQETDKLKLGLVSKNYQPTFLVRRTVAEKLKKVANNLPENIVLVLIEGYRTLEAQTNSWNSKFHKLRAENPNWTDQEVEQKVALVVARPQPLANHHCGGAIDVTLAYRDGSLVNMGTPYPSVSMGAEWHKKFLMLSDEITSEEEENRRILRDAMMSEGFVWYPGEWWHYCWGDRMWAVYSNRPECFYGPIEPTSIQKR